jgi:hypothetical protein
MPLPASEGGMSQCIVNSARHGIKVRLPIANDTPDEWVTASPHRGDCKYLWENEAIFKDECNKNSLLQHQIDYLICQVEDSSRYTSLLILPPCIGDYDVCGKCHGTATDCSACQNQCIIAGDISSQSSGQSSDEVGTASVAGIISAVAGVIVLMGLGYVYYRNQRTHQNRPPADSKDDRALSFVNPQYNDDDDDDNNTKGDNASMNSQNTENEYDMVSGLPVAQEMDGQGYLVPTFACTEGDYDLATDVSSGNDPIYHNEFENVEQDGEKVYTVSLDAEATSSSDDENENEVTYAQVEKDRGSDSDTELDGMI